SAPATTGGPSMTGTSAARSSADLALAEHIAAQHLAERAPQARLERRRWSAPERAHPGAFADGVPVRRCVRDDERLLHALAERSGREVRPIAPDALHRGVDEDAPSLLADQERRTPARPLRGQRPQREPQVERIVQHREERVEQLAE